MIDSFEKGKVWFLYCKLEREFIETTSYVALETKHEKVWSEKFGNLLIRIGSSVGSFFNLMVNSPSLNGQETVERLRKRIEEKRRKRKFWSPTIADFRKAFNPVFKLSDVEVETSYGLTYYDKLRPFVGFSWRKPDWWDAHNKLKHEFYEKLEERATLQNTINALAGLFVLNIMHKESKQYLIRYMDNVIFAKNLRRKERETYLMASFIGIPGNVRTLEPALARTPLFTHILRIDKKEKAF